MANSSTTSGRSVSVQFDSPASLSTRLPSLHGVVSIPYLPGWSAKPFNDLVTRIHGEIVRAVTSRELRKTGLAIALRGRLDDANVSSFPFRASRHMVLEVCKQWCIEHVSNPDALEVLSESHSSTFDEPTVSAILDASNRFGEMGRSRVVGALSEKLLAWPTASVFPAGVSRIFAAAKTLPWEAPAHEQIARAAVELERDLFYEADPEAKKVFEGAINGSVEALVDEYANHPRVAVVQIVAARTERIELLEKIAARAEAIFHVDSRLTYRLVKALAENVATPVHILRPFAQAALWTDKEDQQGALGALLSRAISRPQQPQPSVSERAIA